MKKWLLSSVLALTLVFSFAQNRAQKIVLKCPPCSMACDTIHFHNGSTCPHCGMGLMATYAHWKIKPKVAAILLFPRIDMMDFAWFFEICREAGIQVITVAENRQPVQAVLRSSYLPDYTFEDAPQADFIFIAGGAIDLNNQNMQNWLRQASLGAKAVLSSFNGSHLLAKAGLLDGKTATAANYALDELRDLAPKSTIVADQHFVEAGNIITAAGITATIDATLYLVSKHVDGHLAKMIAHGLEYHWDRPNLHTRADLPTAQDAYLDGLRTFLSQFDPQTLLNEGNAEKWIFQTETSAALSLQDLQQLLNFQLKNVEKWTAKDANNWLFHYADADFEAKIDLNEKGKSKDLRIEVLRK